MNVFVQCLNYKFIDWLTIVRHTPTNVKKSGAPTAGLKNVEKIKIIEF